LFGLLTGLVFEKVGECTSLDLLLLRSVFHLIFDIIGLPIYMQI